MYSQEMNAAIAANFTNIRRWANTHDLIRCVSPHTQMLKLTEYIGGLAAGIAQGNPALIKDSIGNCVVSLTILAAQQELTLEECSAAAYDELHRRETK